MKRIVFYSWQSDLPNSTNRGFIQQALENAVKAIANDNSVKVEPVIDRDTQGVAGSPDIASTIFAKIMASDVFVADVSIIASIKPGKGTPNPNVLIELGYALRGLGHERVILVFNRSFGKIEDLPFDLRMRRVMVYEMPLENQGKAAERQILEKQLDGAIRAALERIPEEEQSVIPAIAAIENNQPNKIIVIRRNLTELLKQIIERKPKMHSAGGTVEELIAAIDSTEEIVAEFAKIVEAASIMKDQNVAIEIYRWLGNILEEYDPETKNGRSSNADGDYFKFLAQEMLVTIVALFIREQQWAILKDLLAEYIPVKRLIDDRGAGTVPWYYASKRIPLLVDESKKQKRLSIHADILNTRHTSGGLSAIVPMDEFSAADFYLFLMSELPPEENGNGAWQWRPWTIIHMQQVPAFIINAEQRKYAQELANSFAISTIDEMKKRLKERHLKVDRLFPDGVLFTVITNRVIDKIGTR
jgi:hypothetical protein